MSTALLYNIGTLITGDLNDPVARADALYIENGQFKEIGTGRTTADTVINARGNMVMPGLIDFEIVYSGNHAVTLELLQMIVKKNLLHRVILGTDTPGGTGVTPRGMLRILAFVASSEEIEPEQAICMATGGPAEAHNLDSGFVREGKPADCLIVGKIQGSSGDTPLGALKEGNLLGISMALIDGRVVVRDRSQQTPPPETGALIEREAGN